MGYAFCHFTAFKHLAYYSREGTEGHVNRGWGHVLTNQTTGIVEIRGENLCGGDSVGLNVMGIIKFIAVQKAVICTFAPFSVD